MSQTKPDTAAVATAALKSTRLKLGELVALINDMRDTNDPIGADYIARQIEETRGEMETALIACEVAL